MKVPERLHDLRKQKNGVLLRDGPVAARVRRWVVCRRRHVIPDVAAHREIENNVAIVSVLEAVLRVAQERVVHLREHRPLHEELVCHLSVDGHALTHSGGPRRGELEEDGEEGRARAGKTSGTSRHGGVIKGETGGGR